MKRHPALIPLSRDHHHGLVQAARLRRAAADGDASARLAAAREFGEFFRTEERVHLRDQEEELFPLLLRHVPSQPAPLAELREFTADPPVAPARILPGDPQNQLPNLSRQLRPSALAGRLPPFPAYQRLMPAQKRLSLYEAGPVTLGDVRVRGGGLPSGRDG
jgi:hypothetical protein